jgi:hypothetical protein
MKEQYHSGDQIAAREAVPLPPESVKEAIERILNSRHFAQAPKKRKFVQLVCDYYLAGRANELNEYLIGREVYERDDHYSQTEDPVVRVAAHDVRKRLEQYYQNEGQNDQIRLDIPVGHYEPVFRYATQSQATNLPRRWKWLPWAVAGLAVIALAGFILAWLIGRGPWTSSLASSVASQLPDEEIYNPVWQPFFKSDDPTILVLSNPLVFVVVNRSDPAAVLKESIPLTTDQTQILEAELKRLDQHIPEYTNPPRLNSSSEGYTGIGEAIGVYRITDLFRSRGSSVTLKQSRNLTAEDLKDRNLIMLGGVMSNVWSGKLPVQEDFYFTSSVALANRNPQPGEQAEYRTRFDERTGQLLEDFALVTVKPAPQSKNSFMILEGIRSVGTGAAAELVTSKSYLAEVNRRLQELASGGNRPRYYQMLLKVGVENQVPTTITILAVHEIRGL